MDQKSLHERLAKLHAELADAHQQNPATRQSLGEILPDVKRMVDEPTGAAAPSTQDPARALGKSRRAVRGRTSDAGGERAAAHRLLNEAGI